MNKIKIHIALAVMILLSAINGKAQNSMFIDAMKQEIKRGMDSLKIDKMLSPNFISYSISDAKTIEIESSLGAILLSEELPYRLFENRLLVGENGKTNENYIDENNLWSSNYLSNRVPFSDNTNDIRRALWLTTDYKYKSAITNYEAKISALKQQNLSAEEKSLVDFSNVAISQTVIPSKSSVFSKTQLENLARTLSVIFKRFPEIQQSDVKIFTFDAQVYYANSEGTISQYPIKIVSVKVVAKTQAPGGERLSDHVLWFGHDFSELPDEKSMVADVEKMANNLKDLSKINAISEPYSGPILFEGQAAAEIFAQVFFSNTNGLISVRKPVAGSEQIVSMVSDRFKENSLEAMFNKKVISRDITIKAFPTLTTFQNKPLLGSFNVDAEGSKVPDTLTLIDNGVLRNLLSNRTPTSKMKFSNGHSRAALSNGGVKSVVGPGVIQMTNNNPTTTVDNKKLKELLIATAKEEDLEYAYIVRKIVSGGANIVDENRVSFFGSSKPAFEVSKTIQVYRVKVSDGSEELVSMAQIKGLTSGSFKRLLATSSDMQVYNTMTQPISGSLNNWNFGLSGIPATFIMPNGLLFQELDIVKEKQSVVKNVPVVASPLTITK